ncbi:MAG: type I-E CRISPR-associated protein Cse2/CasB [Armatimonadota bacterium]
MTDLTVPEAMPDRQAYEGAFLNTLKKLDKGQLAQLKRNAGNPVSEARGISWFYGLLESFHVKEREENLYLLIASLMAMDKNALSDNPRSFSGNFGKTMLQVKKDSSGDGIDRRFGILLDAQFDNTGSGELAFRLRQMVRMVLSKGVGIDWSQLLYDLRRWDSADKWVQKKWARAYYTPDLPVSQVPELSTNEQPISTNEGDN